MPVDQTAEEPELARRFADLWHVLLNDGRSRRTGENRKLLLDQVRDALDRGDSRLAERRQDIIANSFVLEEQLHDGSLTQVHRARHRDIGSFHTIKMLQPKHAHDPLARQLLLREAKIGLSLRHANIVATQVLLRLDDGQPALVFECCEKTLAARMVEERFSASDIIATMQGILSGLLAIHGQAIVHGDLSPSNLLCNGQKLETIMIADFGIALEAGHRQSELDIRFAGQPDFAPPEQKEGKELDCRADLYAAGRIMTLLLENCSNPDRTAGLYELACRLSRPRAEERPENAKAALLMLGGLSNSH